ncbi:MAG TPA: methylthioribulose 1-phosphate dehydratase [Blastocatellia bacterium]|nr:methylthioribulose 1-phosphate dehydratase [Blastocatellia bacterium]
MTYQQTIQEIICELCRQFYMLGWASGTGGGICVRDGDKLWVAPSGVQKERIQPEDLFAVDFDGNVIHRPDNEKLKPSECTSLFLKAVNLRGAGAVIHSHSIHAMLATLVCGKEFSISEIEMIKGIQGMGFHDRLVVPVIENTAQECDLAEALGQAIEAYPKTQAVLVRRHGVYVWGPDWVKAKTQAECYDYLFRAAVEMHRLGISENTLAAHV